MTLYDAVAALPLTVESIDFEGFEQETSSEFTRATTVLELAGDGETGRGEEVGYETEAHEALQPAIAEGTLDIPTGEFTFDGFSAALDDVDLFPGREPERAAARDFRRWAVESAALDLALRQAGESLGSVLGREYSPVRFVVSTRLGDPPTADRVDSIRARNPDAEFKLDPTPAWDDDLVDELRMRDVVRVLDLKGHYEDEDVGEEPDGEFYRRIVEGFPEGVIEDPLVTDETRRLLEANRDRVSWDAPIHGLSDLEALPWEPRWLNVKPSRFGSVASLLECLEWAESRGVTMYGGGQFELSVGRSHVQALASLFYPRGPNDVAPSVYNGVHLPPELPRGPLAVPVGPVGLQF